jgi:hypothetical protein
MKIFGQPVVIQVRVRNYYGKQSLLRLTKSLHLWKAAYRVFGIKWKPGIQDNTAAHAFDLDTGSTDFLRASMDTYFHDADDGVRS